MDIQMYLKQQTSRLARAMAMIKNSRVFDFNYVPEHPLTRSELKPVIDAILRFEQTGIPNNLQIVGSRGCGKTLCVRQLERHFAERGLPILYANCRVHNTSYKLIAHMQGIQARGRSFSELADWFAEANPRKTVVVLDEIDLLADRDRRWDILYFLSRASSRFMVILLSNNPRWASSLDESVKSSLQPDQIFFRPYSASEMSEIIEDRAVTGLAEAPKDVLDQIAALTVKYTDSDARVALKTLYYWAMDPDAPLQETFHRARENVVSEVVKNLSDKNLLILRAAASSPDRPVREVYKNYQNICRAQQEEAFSYTFFLGGLSLLQSLGLILLISTKIHRAYTRLIQLTFPEEVLDRVWRYRFG